jgi:Ca-activated chloride channel homolog
MTRRWLLAVLVGFTVGAVMATQALATPRLAAPTIWVPPSPGLEPIRLDEVAITIDARGFLARTRIELTFHNPNPRVLEGELVFPLAAGQTIAGYALDVEGRMREGVVVPKTTARVAFEDTIRQRIDPGLAELTRGNVFRTRLYPIPPRGNKRVAFTLEQVMDDDGAHYRYLLPLLFREPVRRFSVRAQATADGAGTGQVASPDPALRFDHSGEGWVASFTRENVRPQSELAFAIPRGGAANDVLEAPDALEPATRSFVARVDSGRPDDAPPAPPARRIAMFVDASGSAAARDLARERDVLARLFRGLGDVDVQFVAFRDVVEPAQRITIRNGDAKRLLDVLAALPLDGGSSYGAIDLAALDGVDRVLVIGDGLSNFGDHLPRTGAGRPRIDVLHAAQSADHAALQRLARLGGGQVHDLLRDSTDDALAALQTAQWRLLAVDDVGARCRDVLPRAGNAVGARFTLSGNCDGRGTLRLRFGDGSGAVVTRELQVGERDPVDATLAAAVHRLHAQRRIDELEAEPTPDDAAIAALGTRHGVVTRVTSLLVLDRLEDYLRYRIEPKEADLRAEYLARLASLPKAVGTPTAPQVDALRARWFEFREWHSRRHPWLETVLLPTAEAERSAWQTIARGDDAGQKKRADAALARADTLHERSRELVNDWPQAGAQADTRAAWERDAADVMRELGALRASRADIVLSNQPDDDAQLDRIEVMGSRIIAEVQETPAPPPPPASPARMMAEPAGTTAMEARIPPAAMPGGTTGTPAAPATDARIVLKPWSANAPYLARIRSAADPYAAYLAERSRHADKPAFFLDVADWFREQRKDPALARRILSNLAEIDFDNTALTRVLGYRLLDWGSVELAVGQFEEALRQRDEEPQSYRDLALALARLPSPPFERIVDLLWRVATGDWHARFPGSDIIALHELVDIVARAGNTIAATIAKLGIPGDLLEPLPVGLRVVMTWDADNTDIDLWVTDPSGELANYSRNRSTTGGHVSHDFTDGYGPEVFSIARPLPGTYRVQANYYGDSQQRLTGPVIVQLEFQTDFGTGQAQRSTVTRRLKGARDVVDVGEFEVQLRQAN